MRVSVCVRTRVCVCACMRAPLYLHLVMPYTPEILCSSPPSKENTTMSLSGDGFSIGSVVNYTCSYGYKSTDPSIEVAQSECQISRNWVNLTQPLTCIGKSTKHSSN